jgi:drug/metabolite transporter (DMT)-like permease
MHLKSVLQILLLSAAWGISFLMMRIALPDFPPAWIALLRCALGASLLWLVLTFGGFRLPPRRLLPWLLTVALLNNAVPFSLFAWGEQWVPSSIAAVLNATTPIWTLLLAASVERRMPRRTTGAGVLLAFAGVIAVVATHANDAAPAAVGVAAHGSLAIGAAAIGAAAICYAVASLVAKTRLRGLDPIGLATTQLSLASLLLLPVALGGARPVDWGALAPLGAIAVLGFVGSGIAYLLYYRLLAEISATQVVAVTYLMPVWGVFWGTLAHEAIGTATMAGAAVTVAGLVLLNLPARGAKRVAP